MNTDANQDKTTDSSKKCSLIIPSGDTFALNETLNGETVCTSQSGALLLELPDSSRTGREWVVTSTPGLLLADEGTIWYDENGVPTTVPGLGRGVRTWKIQILETGTQKIHAELQFPAGGKQSSDMVVDITIVIA